LGNVVVGNLVIGPNVVEGKFVIGPLDGIDVADAIVVGVNATWVFGGVEVAVVIVVEGNPTCVFDGVEVEGEGIIACVSGAGENQASAATINKMALGNTRRALNIEQR